MRHTAPQTALDRHQRQLNVRDAFALDPARAGAVRGRSVVLVDDVMTSGASLFSAADLLRRAGAKRVSALAFARTDEAVLAGMDEAAFARTDEAAFVRTEGTG